MLTTQAEFIDDFVDDTGNAVEDIQPFVEEVRSFLKDDETAASISDEEIVLLAMLPAPLTERSNDFDRALTLECDEKTTEVFIARITDLMVETFDVAFVILGSVFGGIGKLVCRQIATRAFAGPRGARFANRVANVVSSTGKSPALLADVVSETIAEVGLNGILDAISEAPDISGWDIAVTGLSFLANLLAIGLSGGVVLSVKIAAAGLAARDWYKSIDAVLEYERLVCPPTMAPSRRPTPIPTRAPTRPPTPRPTPRPSRSPTPRQPTNPSGRGWTTGVFGDPHLSTFDRLRFDCQASGEFTMVSSLETPDFAIQERLESAGSGICSQASVSTGVVVNEPGIPTVQISIAQQPGVNSTGNISVSGNECPVNVYVDGAIQDSFANLTNLNDQVEIEIIGTSVRVFFPFTGVQARPTMRYSASFGCHFTLQVFIPFEYRSDETILGLLGTPNKNRGDDWISADGSPYTPPATVEDSIFSPSYTYCATQ